MIDMQNKTISFIDGLEKTTLNLDSITSFEKQHVKIWYQNGNFRRWQPRYYISTYQITTGYSTIKGSYYSYRCSETDFKELISTIGKDFTKEKHREIEYKPNGSERVAVNWIYRRCN